ncbi:MAG TPA: MFS transporter, partial [Myxococcota bacterium]|nr:MFS transporter [Myxococcota bacterium]
FLVNVPLGIVAGALCATFLHDPPHLVRNPRGRIDWPGIALLVIGIGCFQTLLERGNKDDWFESPTIVWLGIASVVGLVGLVIRELSTDDPVIDFSILRDRTFALGCLLTMAGGFALFGVVFLFPIYAQTLLGWTAWQSGLGSLPPSLSTAITMAIMGRIIWHTGPRVLYLTGMVMMILTLREMATWTLASGWDDVLAGQTMRGVASGLLFVPLSAATLRALAPEDIAKGSGLFNLSRQLGGSFGIAILAAVLDRRSDQHKVELARHLSPFDASTRATFDDLARSFADRGLDEAGADFAARTVFDGMLSAQAMMESFYDAFFLMAVVFVVLFPLGLLVPKHMPGKLEAKAAARERAEREAAAPEPAEGGDGEDDRVGVSPA